jgi:G protein-coupled receptor 158
MKLHSAVLSNGELDIADVNLADMDTTEVAAELRRCYTQIEILRNKTMRKDNPHISKRRGGRKGTHRRFSLQPFTHKPSSHHHHHEHHSSVIPEGREDEEEATKSSKKSNKRAGKSSIHDYMDQTEVSRTPEESTASVEGNPGFNDQSGSSNRKTSGPGP